MSSQNMLDLKNITKRFPGVLALSDVSISLKHSEILSICGENGAGKSTLMKVLAGDYPHSTYDGEIVLDGKPLKIVSTGYAESAGIAMIYQEINVELDLSVTENIMLGHMVKNKLGFIDWKKTEKIAKQALDKLKVDLDVNSTMRNLSASVQQLVCIARALVRNPKILILDEPTAALTESETENLMEILKDLKASGISCVYISHKLDEVFRISDRIVVMRDGRVVSEYLKEQINASNIIEDMIGTRMDDMYPAMSGRAIGNEVLRVENLTVKHPNSSKDIVSNINFSVKKGEVVGLVGLVGSGRTEILRSIFGVLPKRSGKVYVDGKLCNIKSAADAIRCGLGLLTEERKKDGIIGTMDITENMTLSILGKIRRFLFINKDVERKLVNEYFSSLRIKAPSVKTNIMTLSGGNQQKVMLAKSLLTDMKVLFLDEPTRGIDVGAKSEIYKIIEDLSKKGLSIIMVSSEYPELLNMCDRFIVIGNGKMLAEANRGEVDEKQLIRLASGV